MLKKLNPVKIIGIWVLLVTIFDLFTVPGVIRSSSGTYTTPMDYFIRSVSIMMIGIWILSILPLSAAGAPDPTDRQFLKMYLNSILYPQNPC